MRKYGHIRPITWGSVWATLVLLAFIGLLIWAGRVMAERSAAPRIQRLRDGGARCQQAARETCPELAAMARTEAAR